MKKITTLIVMAALCLFFKALARDNTKPPNKTLTGTVTDVADQKPLQGANVKFVPGGTGTTTDKNGRFTLSIPQSEGSLTITFIGYQPQRIALTGQMTTPLNIQLRRDSSLIEEVVIKTGYQSISKERMTGSVVQIDSKLVNRSTGVNILDRLNGIASGLRFNGTALNNVATTPGNRVLGINIRGEATLSGNVSRDPLIVVDNFPYEGNIANINPNDIESISILKDAASASIWGARAGNGVIVITTRKGKKNQAMQVNMTANFTLSQKPDLNYDRNYLGAADYINVETELFNSGYFNSQINDTRSRPPLSPVVELLARVRNGTLTAAEAETQIAAFRQMDLRKDQLKYAYRTAVNQQYALGMRGGSTNNSYNFSLGYDKNLNQLVRNGFDRLTLNAGNVYSPLKGLDISTGIYYSRNTTAANNAIGYQGLSVGGPVAGIYPYAQLADAGGNPLPVAKGYRAGYVTEAMSKGLLDWQYRPLDELALADNTTKAADIILKAGVRYTFDPHLRAELQYQNERQTVDTRNYQAPGSYAARDLVNRFTIIDATTGAKTYQVPRGGILNLGDYLLNSGNGRFQLNYDNLFAEKHEVTALAGAELRELSTSSYTRTSLGYNDEYGTSSMALNYSVPLPVNPYGTASIPSPDGTVRTTLNRFVSYYVNVGYIYDSKYTLTLSGRKDGANIFGVRTNERVTPLWSAGLGWEISKEDLYRLKWLPYLRARFSYGYNGNVYNGNAYATGTFSTSSLTGATIIGNITPPNPELSWERVQNMNMGIDFRTVHGRLSGTVEYFVKKGQHLIQRIPLYSSSGFDYFNGNAASTSGHGFDITLNSRNLTGKLKWATVLLLSTQKDKVTEYDVPFSNTSLTQNGGGGIPAVGKPLYSLFAYQWNGLDPKTGDPQGQLNGMLSKNYAGIIGNFKPDSLQYMGTTRPTVYGSLRNDISFQNFTLSANILYEFGFVFRRNSVSLNKADLIAGANGQHWDYASRWQQPGDEQRTSVPSLSYPSNNNRNTFYQYSAALVEKGDHIRLQDIRLSYDLPVNARNKGVFKSVQLFSYASNLGIVWRANKLGLDPALRNFYGHALPLPFTISFGANIQF